MAQVFLLKMPGRERLVAKASDRPDEALETEGAGLRYLRAETTLPVPGVVHCDDTLLVMEFVEGESVFSPDAERHAAELLAELHEHTSPRFGFERPTPLGGLMQANGWVETWIEFFRDRRLLPMADEAARAGRLPREVRGRIGGLAARLGEFLDAGAPPSLIHGDVWTSNVLARGDRIVAFLDPAISFAHAELELAFVTLFGTFGTAFFDRYAAVRGIRPGFFETRRDLLNLYPLLVHVRLFGGGYVGAVEGALRGLGF